MSGISVPSTRVARKGGPYPEMELWAIRMRVIPGSFPVAGIFTRGPSRSICPSVTARR